MGTYAPPFCYKTNFLFVVEYIEVKGMSEKYNSEGINNKTYELTKDGMLLSESE